MKEETLKNGGLHWINLNVEIQVDDQAIETAKSLRKQSLKQPKPEIVFNLGQSGKRQRVTCIEIVDGKKRILQSTRRRSPHVSWRKPKQKRMNTDDKIGCFLARKWDHNVEGLIELSAPLAEKLDMEGQERMASEEWVQAYEAFALSMALDPSRSHTRRRAEEARDKKLNITPPYKKRK